MAATFTAAILKFLFVDGKGVFNPIGGYAWCAIWTAAGAIAFME
jgi:hypothetical protein